MQCLHMIKDIVIKFDEKDTVVVIHWCPNLILSLLNFVLYFPSLINVGGLLLERVISLHLFLII